MPLDLSSIQKFGDLMRRVGQHYQHGAFRRDFEGIGGFLAQGDSPRTMIESMAQKGRQPVFGAQGVGEGLVLVAADMLERAARHEAEDEFDRPVVQAVQDLHLEEEFLDTAGKLRRLAEEFRTVSSFE